MSDNKGRGHSFSWSLAALIVVSAAGSALTFAVTSTQVQNAIGILSCGAVASIIVYRLHRASDVVDAALRLAVEIADVRHAPAERARADGDSMARVIMLPGQRPVAEERSDAS